MIIRMTVDDNDFIDVLERFASTLLNKLLFNEDEEFEKIQKSDNIESLIEFMHHQREISSMLNPNNDKNLNEKQREIICEDVQKYWKRFLQSPMSRVDHDTEDDTSKYLEDNFKVSIWYRMFDKWENGEVVYLFTNANKHITQ